MTAAVVYGATSGALHAVTGPDHVLSLGPVALTRKQPAFQVGLLWGAGHGAGTLLIALPLLLLSHAIDLHWAAAIGERMAGAALLATACWSWWSGRVTAQRDGSGGVTTRSPLLVGFTHGLTGAGAFVLVLPVLVAGNTVHSSVFLMAFAAGSSLAMAVLTTVIGRAGARLSKRATSRIQRAMTFGALLLGSYWLLVP